VQESQSRLISRISDIHEHDHMASIILEDFSIPRLPCRSLNRCLPLLLSVVS
jgi:hypothetical protein